MGPIDEFLEAFRHNRKEYVQIEIQLGIQLRALFDDTLHGHRYLWESRVKEVDPLEKKLRSRSHEYIDESQNVEDIKDLVGGRIIYASQLDFEHVGKIIDRNIIIKHQTHHPKVGLDRDQRFRGYAGLHFYVTWQEPSFEQHSDLIMEIQVMSAFMWAFAALKHDIEYKKKHGELTSEVKLSLNLAQRSRQYGRAGHSAICIILSSLFSNTGVW